MQVQASRVILVGWATDFCVDGTVRGAVSRGFNVVVASDCHTLDDRPHMRARDVIAHHNWVWKNLITQGSSSIEKAAEIMSG